MSTYYRPNLTADERDKLTELVEDQLHLMSWEDPKFKAFYLLALKLRECKEISTAKR